MGTVCRIGMDIAKQKMQLHGVDEYVHDVLRKQLNRKDVLAFFANTPKCLVGIEACGGAHYWARELTALGHEVRLISPRLVKPFVINNKTDAADARAICEIVGRPATKFVSIKTVDQQALAALHRVRERLVGNRTAIVNQARSFLLEIGIIVPQGISHMRSAFALFHQGEHPQCPGSFREIMSDLYEEFLELDRRIEAIDFRLQEVAKTDESCKRLLQIPGVGPLTATAIVAHMGDARQFKNGRAFAACMGLTPREYSSGGKQKLLGISKRGNSYIRKLLIQGGASYYDIGQRVRREMTTVGNGFRVLPHDAAHLSPPWPRLTRQPELSGQCWREVKRIAHSCRRRKQTNRDGRLSRRLHCLTF